MPLRVDPLLEVFSSVSAEQKNTPQKLQEYISLSFLKAKSSYKHFSSGLHDKYMAQQSSKERNSHFAEDFLTSSLRCQDVTGNLSHCPFRPILTLLLY